MATPKYKKQIEIMLAEHKDTFEKYFALEEKFKTSPKKYKEEVAETRRDMLKIMRKHENRLCARTENTKYSAYSENLAMKYWEDLRIIFPDVEKVVQ